MAQPAVWRSASAYVYLDHINRSGFSWEFLRRNREYQSAFAVLLAQRHRAELLEAFSRRWGLRFRD